MAWYHISFKTLKRKSSVEKSLLPQNKPEHDGVSPTAFGRGGGSQCSPSWLLGGYWQFSQTAVQHCDSRAGVTLWHHGFLNHSWSWLCVFHLSIHNLSILIQVDSESYQWTLELLLEFVQTCLNIKIIQVKPLLRSLQAQNHYGFGAQQEIHKIYLITQKRNNNWKCWNAVFV